MTRRELTGHQARSATTIHGWPAVFFGVPFLAAGIGAYVVQRLAPESIQGPRLLMVWFAGIFGLVGLLMIVHGLRGLRRRAGVARRRAAHPGQPWLWDYEWDRSGASDDTRRRLWRAIFVSVFFVAFLLPFNWIGFAMPDVSGRGLWMAIVGLFDLVTVAVIGRAVYLLLRYLKYGTSTVSFDTFPFFLGDELAVRFEGSGRGEIFDRMTATLRCVEERYETRGSGKNRSQRVVCYEVYADAQNVEGARARWEGLRGLALRFPLPEEEQPTRLGERPPRYWELEVKAEVPGVDYKGTFLVPVYAKAGP
jgi:hypothetical protein